MGTKTKDLLSPHKWLIYTNVRKKSWRMAWILVTMFTFCWRNLRNLLVGEDGCACHLMINLFCELCKSLMYFSQGILRGTRRSCLLTKVQGPFVRRPISGNPGLDFNPGFFFFYFKAFLGNFSLFFWKYPINKLYAKKN